MTMELSEHEHNLLRELIEKEISELQPEIQHTGRSVLRDQLRERRNQLQDLLRRFGGPSGKWLHDVPPQP